MMSAPFVDELDFSPFTEATLFELGRCENWPALRQILKPIAEFRVVDIFRRAFVDETRKKFDSSKEQAPSNKCIVMTALDAANCDDDAYDVLKLLLAAGVDPDQPCGGDLLNWCPAHQCGYLAFPKAAVAIFACRPDMTRKNKNKSTPFDAADHLGYKADGENPQRKVMRAEVVNILKLHGYDSGSVLSIADLALRRMWCAVLNLMRRNKVPQDEFSTKAGGKTALEWANFYAETDIAQEIEYYSRPWEERMVAACQELRGLATEMSANKLELSHTKRRVDSLECKIQSLENRLAEKEKKNRELSELLAALSSEGSPAAGDDEKHVKEDGMDAHRHLEKKRRLEENRADAVQNEAESDEEELQ